MRPNICSDCFSKIFEEDTIPPYIRTVVGDGDCEVCGDRAWFYARSDEIELAKKIRKENQL